MININYSQLRLSLLCSLMYKVRDKQELDALVEEAISDIKAVVAMNVAADAEKECSKPIPTLFKH
jgi:hypothetical protein